MSERLHIGYKTCKQFVDKRYGLFTRLSWMVPINIGSYSAFTYRIFDKASIINYIKNQKGHHKTESSFDDYKRLLIENGIDFDIKYLYNLTPKYSTPLGLLHLCYVTTGCTRGYFDLTLSGLFPFG